MSIDVAQHFFIALEAISATLLAIIAWFLKRLVERQDKLEIKVSDLIVNDARQDIRLRNLEIKNQHEKII